jgi:hypothetical protein
VARTSMITEAFTERICALVREGMRLKEALYHEGVGRSTQAYLTKEAESGREPYCSFLDAVARAEAQFEREQINAIRLQSTPTAHGDVQDWKARKDLLQARFPDRWAPTQTMVLKAQDQAAQDVLEVAREVLPSQWYAALLAALAGVGEADAQGDADEGDEAH